MKQSIEAVLQRMGYYDFLSCVLIKANFPGMIVAGPMVYLWVHGSSLSFKTVIWNIDQLLACFFTVLEILLQGRMS